MNRKSIHRAALTGLLLLVAPAIAIEIGDPAPPLKIAEWVKGKAVDLKAGKGKNVFLIEFWATWCPPCRATIPHLTELQKKHKEQGLVVIGVSNENAETVRAFVKQMADKMEYTVAVDKDDAMMDAYMQAFGIDTIPHGFLIDKAGRIVWHGGPGPEMDKVIEDVLAGKYDIEAAKNASKAMKLLPEYFRTVQRADKARDATEKKDLLKKARETGDNVLKLGGKSSDLMNAFAWTLLTSPEIKNRDLDLAMKAAKAAYDASEGKSADILDTYARALFDTGKKAEAIKMQKKAVDICKDERLLKELKKALERYEKEATEK